MQTIKLFGSMPQGDEWILQRGKKKIYIFQIRRRKRRHSGVTLYQTNLVVNHRVGGVEVSDLLDLVSGSNSKLTAKIMADLRYQGIAVNDKTNPVRESIPYKLTQQLNPLIC